MPLLIIVIALGFLQVWGSHNPLHRDSAFRALSNFLSGTALASSAPILIPIIVPAIVVLPLGLLIYWILDPSMWYGGVNLLLSVIILLYSFGRGEFAEIIAEYTKACYVEDWPSSLERAESIGVNTEGVNTGDWSALHERVLEEASYRGFERMFAVIFWFVSFGPLGALFYRLLFLHAKQQKEDVYAAHLLWAMEWIPARILGLSFSFTGNFVGCWVRWRELLFCRKSKTELLLSRSALGALSVAEDVEQTCEVTRKELNLLSRLYARSLWFWLGTIAISTVLL